ncbi:MAG: DUF362 domain-containing protein [Candidatus Edwardsbacteria bacterium]
MPAKVYFTDLRCDLEKNLLSKLANLFDKAELGKIVSSGDLVALKIHFGERGNTAFIPPFLVRVIVDKVKSLGGKPFLTDTNTLYTGSRVNAIAHLQTAIANGFDYSVVDCPLVIADGLKGNSFTEVEITGRHFRKVKIGAEIYQAEAMIALTHFKGHELTGFGGAIKNLGMGCASRGGKLAIHSSIHPKVRIERCIGCGECLTWCPVKAISLIDKKARIDSKICLGCAECTLVCRQHAIGFDWDEGAEVAQQKMVEHALGTVKNKKGKVGFLNFIMKVTPACDCYPSSDTAIVPDIGILASFDAVAIDQASVDLVNQSEGLKDTALKKAFKSNSDKFRDIYPAVDWSIQLDYGTKSGLGAKEYELIFLDKKI